MLNVRVACDDSGQNWFHTLNTTVAALDVVLEAWPDVTDASLQSDGAGNFCSTATLISLPRAFASRGIKLRRAVISEVGDGKNLVDTDFQQVQMALSQRIASGANVETAQDILDNLNANPTAGTANAAIDLGGRADEPGKAAMPKPLAGIDSLYDREYEYDAETGAWTTCVLRQFFRQGEGKRVSAAVLRGLWKQQEPQLSLQPARLQPSGGARAVAPKLKPSEEGAAAERLAKRMRSNAREQRRLLKAMDAAAKEAAVVAAATTHRCPHEGCRHRPFLLKNRAAEHAEHYCPFRPGVQARQSVNDSRAKVKAQWCKGRVRLDLAQGSGGVVKALLRRTAIAPLRVSVKAQRPLAPPTPYGLQKFSVTPAAPLLPSAELRAACGVRSTGVRATLSVQAAAPPRVMLQLAVGARAAPELLGKGWAQRPPVVHTRFTAEQKALLVELFERPDRPNETQMFDIFQQRFGQATGAYARQLRLTRAQIKSFMSTEKGRRQKAAACGVVGRALQDGSLNTEQDGREDGEAEGEDEGAEADDADAQRREGASAAAPRRTPAVGGGRAPLVPDMRKAASALGWGAEVRAAKGTKAVLAVLQRAQAAPRAMAPTAAAESDSGDSSDDAEEEDGDAALEGSDVYEVDTLLEKRRRGGVVTYLVKWKGVKYRGQESWEPVPNIPRAIIREFEEERGPDEETDDDAEPDDASDDSDSSDDDARVSVTTTSPSPNPNPKPYPYPYPYP